jgi:chemotaxis regulatin CheY-phosphate phosphatase CheZ
VKVMADYGCHPLWDVGSSGPGNIDPQSMPISPSLASSLREWSQRYDQTLDRSSPQESAFSTSSEHRQFVDDGWLLSRQLAVELGERWSVLYFDDLTGETRLAVSP